MILFTGTAQLNYYLSLMWRSRIICCDLFYYYYYYHYFICARINQWQSIQEWNNLINNADIRALSKNHRKSLFVLVWKRFFKHDNTEINCIFLKSIICKYFSVLPRRSPHILPGSRALKTRRGSIPVSTVERKSVRFFVINILLVKKL